MRRLEGRVAIVTGAAQGIGRASVERFAHEGATTVLADVDPAGAAVADAITAAGGRAAFVRTDVTRDDELEALVGSAVERFGRIDVLFNNAGIGCYVPFDRLAPSEWDRIHAVNLRAVYRACQIALPHLRAVRGVILNTASQSGLEGQAMNAAYCASKAGVVLLTRSLAREYGPDGVRVNCLCPGGVDTALLRGFLDAVGAPAARVAEGVPLRRFARPDEIAAAAAFLVSDDASYVTGVALPIDGGGTA
jgi:NAD(P)-dependent dehydrogenase (short-subunit alcohol dehydrogenase family)